MNVTQLRPTNDRVQIHLHISRHPVDGLLQIEVTSPQGENWPYATGGDALETLLMWLEDWETVIEDERENDDGHIVEETLRRLVLEGGTIVVTNEAAAS